MGKKAPIGKRKFRPKADTGTSTKDCLCGCGGHPKGRFLPGHDAKLKGRLKKEALGEDSSVAAAAIARLASLGWSWVLDTTPEQKAARKAALEATKAAKAEAAVHRAEMETHKMGRRGLKSRLLADGSTSHASDGPLKSAEGINHEYKADFAALQLVHGQYGVPKAEVDRLQRRMLDDFTRLAG